MARAEQTRWLRGVASGPSELRTGCAPSPSPRWRRQRLAQRTLPTPPRERCASALAAAFGASLRPDLVPQTLCSPFPGSSAERFRASQPLTPLPSDFIFPPLEGVSAVAKRSRSGASLAAAANLTTPQLGWPKLAHEGERVNFVAASAALSPSKSKRASS